MGSGKPADPRGPRVGDVNGDGAADVVLLLVGFFNMFQNLAADQDVLVGISDGMNDHDPGEPGFVPSVAVSYGHLIESTNLYRSRVGAANGCDYPCHCVVGARGVVSEYALSDGEGGQRRFSVRYEDGRYHRLLGSLGEYDGTIIDYRREVDPQNFAEVYNAIGRRYVWKRARPFLLAN